MNRFSRTLCAALAVAAPAAPALAAPASAAVVNGGFESLTATGFTGWAIAGAGIAPDAAFPNNGDSDAAFFDVTTPVSTLTQAIATTPGSPYALSFALLDESGLAADRFTVAFGGFSATILGSQAAPPGQSASLYTTFSLAVPGAAITRNQTSLIFGASVDPSSGTAWNLDDVTLTAAGPTSPIPAPGAAALAAAAAVLAWRRRARRS